MQAMPERGQAVLSLLLDIIFVYRFFRAAFIYFFDALALQTGRLLGRWGRDQSITKLVRRNGRRYGGIAGV